MAKNCREVDTEPKTPPCILTLGEASDGLFAWTVPNDPTTNAFVLVVAYDAAGNTSEDLSDLAFTITTPPAQTITIQVTDGWDQKSLADRSRVGIRLPRQDHDRALVG